MLQGRPRELAKRLLVISRAKLVFDRITKTRHTRFYFFLSAFTCLFLCALQAVILSDNTKAVDILTEVVDAAETPPHVTVLKNGELYVCDTIPDRQDSNCILLWTSDHETGLLSVEKRSTTRRNRRTRLRRQAPVGAEDDSADEGGVSSASEDSDGGVESGDDGVSSDDEKDDVLEVPQNPGGQAPAPPPAPATSTSSSAVSTVAISTPAPPPATSARTSSISSVAVSTVISVPAPTPTSSSAPLSTSSSTSPTTTTPTSTGISTSTSVSSSSSSSSSASPTTSSSSTVSTTRPTTSSSATSSTANSTTSSRVSSSTASSTSARGITSASPTSIVTVSTAGSITSITFSSTSVAGTTSIAFTAAPSQTVSASTSRALSSTRTSQVANPTSTKVLNPDSPRNSGISLSSNSNTPHSMSCIYSLSWLEEVLHDSQREDVATLFFQFWLFGLGLVAILNESLPHLGAALVGHLMSAGWSSSRIQGARSLASLYRDFIVPGPCEGVDLLGTWWELRLAHTIPVVVFNIIGLFGLGFMSYKLLRVYSAATFDKVGPTRALQRAYKLVLLFSVGLQLSGFFTAVSSGLWLSKVAHGNFKELSHHEGLYTASFVVILTALFPWLILGWVCVRKECKKRFWLFAILSAGLLSISGVMFGSDAYTSIFKSWRFFATVTITSFILLVLTVVLGLLCYLNYGKGLQTYLHLSEEPEGADFDPVGGFKDSKKLPDFYDYAPTLHEKNDLEWSSPRVLPQPPSVAEVNQYVSRTAPPIVPPPQPPASSNPFESDMDSVAESKCKSEWTTDTSDIDAQSFRTMPSPEPSLGGHAFLLQPPPRSVGPQPRVPSFTGTVASLVPFEGLPAPPFTPHPPTRAGSVRSITRSPFPTASVKSNQNARSSISSVSSASSTSSTRSIKRSPFPLTPVTNVRANSIRDSGYTMSSSDQSSLIGRYMHSESEMGLSRSIRQSMASSVGGEYQTVGAPGRRGTFGTGTPLVEEVPRSLYIVNQL